MKREDAGKVAQEVEKAANDPQEIISTLRKELERADERHQSLVSAITKKAEALERDLKSLQGAHRVKGDRNVQLEAEILRLKTLRTDEQLRHDVEGLRKVLSERDREVSQLRKDAVRLEESSKEAVRNAQKAVQRAEAFQATLETMQTAREAAQDGRDTAWKRMEAAEQQWAEVARKATAAESEAAALARVRDQAVKVLRILPPAFRKERDVRVLSALLKEPEEIAELAK